jgi:long-chain acyl-CoA synthetase
VLEVGAVGVPDGPAGEAVKVVVVRKDRSIGESQVRAYARERRAAPQWPKIVEFRDELPKTAVGRVLRRELRG